MIEPNDCESVQRLISAGRDERLPSSGRRTIDEHLRRCEGCREFFAMVEAHSATLKALPAAEINTDLGFNSEKPSKRPYLKKIWSARISVPAPIAAVAVIAVVALAAFNPGFFGRKGFERAGEGTSAAMGQPAIEYVQSYRLAPQRAALEWPAARKSN